MTPTIDPSGSSAQPRPWKRPSLAMPGASRGAATQPAWRARSAASEGTKASAIGPLRLDLSAQPSLKRVELIPKSLGQLVAELGEVLMDLRELLLPAVDIDR